MKDIWVATSDYDKYLWEDGTLKREKIQADARESAKVHARGNAFRTYCTRFHDQREVQNLADEVVEAWFRGSHLQFIYQDEKKERSWRDKWWKKRKEMMRVFKATFIQTYNQEVQRRDAEEGVVNTPQPTTPQRASIRQDTSQSPKGGEDGFLLSVARDNIWGPIGVFVSILLTALPIFLPTKALIQLFYVMVLIFVGGAFIVWVLFRAKRRLLASLLIAVMAGSSLFMLIKLH